MTIEKLIRLGLSGVSRGDGHSRGIDDMRRCEQTRKS